MLTQSKVIQRSTSCHFYHVRNTLCYQLGSIETQERRLRNQHVMQGSTLCHKKFRQVLDLPTF